MTPPMWFDEESQRRGLRRIADTGKKRLAMLSPEHAPMGLNCLGRSEDWCVRLSFAAHALKGGHDVRPKLRDQSGSARTRIRQAPDTGGVTKDLQRRLKRYNEAGETGAPAPEPPRRVTTHPRNPLGRGRP